jgi:hypothetical protein
VLCATKRKGAKWLVSSQNISFRVSERKEKGARNGSDKVAVKRKKRGEKSVWLCHNSKNKKGATDCQSQTEKVIKFINLLIQFLKIRANNLL